MCERRAPAEEGSPCTHTGKVQVLSVEQGSPGLFAPGSHPDLHLSITTGCCPPLALPPPAT